MPESYRSSICLTHRPTSPTVYVTLQNACSKVLSQTAHTITDGGAMSIISKGRGTAATRQTHGSSVGHSRLLQAAVALTLMSSRCAIAAEDPQTPSAPAIGSAAELSEVAVVARRIRPDDQTSATGLQLTLVETPQAITIVTPEMMRLVGATNIYQAADFVPGMTINGTGYGLDRIYMRGNRITSHRINGSRFSSLHSLDAFTMDRIEVVRGPATALYGVTGSFGGEINNILKRPQASFQSELGIEAGDYDRTRVEADLTGPIAGDRLTGRIVGTYMDYGAPVDVVDISNNQYTIAGSLQFEFSENTSARVWLFDHHLDEDPYDGGSLQLLPEGTCEPKRCLVIPDVPAGDWYFSDPRYSRNLVSEQFVVADLTHAFSNDWQFKTQAVLAEHDRKIGVYYTFGPFGAYDLADDEAYFYQYEQATQGKNLTFDMSLGGEFGLMGRQHQFFAALEYYDDTDPFENLLYNSIGLGKLNMLGGGRGLLADGTPYPIIDRSTLTPRRLTQQGSTDFRASLQLLLNPLERLDILIGTLYQESDIHSVTLINSGVVLPTPEVRDESYDEIVSRFGFTYGLVEDRGTVDALNVYFNYSEGFNPNLNVRDADGNPLTTPQVMEQYEVGIKGEFLNHALGASLAVYDSEVTNIPVGLNFLGQFGNAGSALEGIRKVKGLELELIGQPRPGLNLAANYAYTDSEISDPNYPFVTNVQGVPRNQGAIFASYEFLDGALRGLTLGGSIVAMDDYTFVPSLANIRRFGQLETGSNTRYGVNISYLVQADWGRGMELYASGTNLTDEIIYYEKEDHPGFGITRELPRTYTFGVRYNFGQR